MSSITGNVQVRMVRIQWPDKKQPITHTNNVTVGIPKDTKTHIAYLRISVNQQVIYSDELNHFQWLDESCSNGVVTINSSSVKIIIIYDSKNTRLHDFFVEMEELLKQGPRTELPVPPPRPHNQVTQEHTELATNDLIKYIEEGSPNDAGRAARYLAQLQSNIQFHLISHNDDEESRTKTKKSEAGTSTNVLQLTLHIECHLNRQPLVGTIYVRSGTNLRSLKEQIETETGIRRKDQYWYAFGRYIISDEYEFGSSSPVVPSPKNVPRKQVAPPTDPIRSGDILVMCIAQIRPYD